MTRPVSIVIPALGEPELLAKSFAALLAEVDHRALDDEILCVDDSGENTLEPALGTSFPRVRFVVRSANGGFAHALESGVEAARHELVFSANSDVVSRLGFLDPLVACLDDEKVFAAVPRILLNGDESKVESYTQLEWRRGEIFVLQPGLGRDGALAPEGSAALPRVPAPIAFPVGGAVLFRRADFLARGGFDPLFEPFYWEDVDLGWDAWRTGRRILYQPASVVEHHHRGTIGKRVPPALVRSAIEKNRLLFQWKYLQDPERCREHVEALYRTVVDAWLGGERDVLVWLALALEQWDEVVGTRSSLPAAQRSFDEILSAARGSGSAGEGAD